MPFADGDTLRGRITCGAIPLEKAAPILRDVARAYPHAHRVVHRDIKPENPALSETLSSELCRHMAKTACGFRTPAVPMETPIADRRRR